MDDMKLVFPRTFLLYVSSFITYLVFILVRSALCSSWCVSNATVIVGFFYKYCVIYTSLDLF